MSDPGYTTLCNKFPHGEVDVVNNKLRAMQDYARWDRYGLGYIVYFYLILCKLDLCDWVE